MQPARFSCDARCLHHQLLFRIKKQNKRGRDESKKPAKFCLPATVSGHYFPCYGERVSWKIPKRELAALLKEAVTELECRSTATCSKRRARCEQTAAICSLDFLALVRPSLWLHRRLAAVSDLHFLRLITDGGRAKMLAAIAQRHSPGVAKIYQGWL